MRDLERLSDIQNRIHGLQYGFRLQGDAAVVATLLAEVIDILIDIETSEDSPARTTTEGDRDGR